MDEGCFVIGFLRILEIESYSNIEYTCLGLVFNALNLFSCVSVKHTEVVAKLYIVLFKKRNACTDSDLDI